MFEVVDKIYVTILMEGKYYNITTLPHPLSHTKTLSYIHTIKYLIFSLIIYYLSYLLPTTYKLTYHIN
jgi:hypothetical protein